MNSKVYGFLKLVRWFHLVVAILPFLVLYTVIQALVTSHEIPVVNPAIDLVMLCLGVQLLIAIGCVHNDLEDAQIDAINKPKTRVIGLEFSKSQALYIAAILTFLLSILSRYIIVEIMFEWLWIVITMFTASFMYNRWFKRLPLIGNVWIAMMSSCIPLVILFFQNHVLESLDFSELYELIFFYAAFPFILIVARELSLDISDIEGDKRLGCQTLPIAIGVKPSRLIVVLLLVSLALLTNIFAALSPFLWRSMLALDCMLLVYIYLFIHAKSRLAYIKAGRWLWMTMIVTLLTVAISTYVHLSP